MGSMYNPPHEDLVTEQESKTIPLGIPKEELNKKLQQLGESANKMGEKVSGKIDQALGATASGLDKTSTKISKVADYFREKDTERLVGDLGGVIKKNPTQSMIAGLILGIMLGRLFK